MVVSSRLRHEKEYLLRPPLQCSDTQFCFLATEWISTDTPDSIFKTADCFKHFSSNTCTAKERVAYCYWFLRYILIGTTDDPVKFLGKPCRTLIRPEWLY